MLRTVRIQLVLTDEQARQLAELQAAYADACNKIVPVVRQHRIWNRVKLHHLVYRMLRDSSPLSGRMCCNAIQSVCKAYKALKEQGRIRKNQEVPLVNFKRGSVHYHKDNYTIKGDMISLSTLEGRILVPMRLGEYQRRLLGAGKHKEGELVFRKGHWYFHLVVELEDVPFKETGSVMGVDIGENNLAATSLGKVFGGGALRDRRDRYLALRRRLQRNGSWSAKQKLRQASGAERRRVTHTNHEVSKQIVQDAVQAGVSVIVMENLKHIRSRIKAGKRVRSRLHRWAFRQLQWFIEYKAEAVGIRVVYVNPAYTSRTCSVCGGLGVRSKHRFECPHCGLRAHSDVNASRNLARIGETAVSSRAFAGTPYVGATGVR